MKALKDSAAMLKEYGPANGRWHVHFPEKDSPIFSLPAWMDAEQKKLVLSLDGEAFTQEAIRAYDALAASSKGLSTIQILNRRLLELGLYPRPENPDTNSTSSPEPARA